MIMWIMGQLHVHVLTSSGSYNHEVSQVGFDSDDTDKRSDIADGDRKFNMATNETERKPSYDVCASKQIWVSN